MKKYHYLQSLIRVFLGLILLGVLVACANNKSDSGTSGESTSVVSGKIADYCNADTIKLHPNGAVQECIIRQPYSRKNYAIPSGTMVRFSETGAVVFAWIQDTLTLGEHVFPKGSKLYFNNSTDKELVNDIQLVVLAGDTNLNGIEFHADDRITFDDSGALASIKWSQPSVYKGFSFATGAFIELYPDGNLYRWNLGKPLVLNGMSLERGDHVSFYKSKGFAQLSLSSQRVIHTVPYQKQDTLEFYPTGEVLAFMPSSAIQLYHLDFNIGDLLLYRKDHTVQLAIHAQTYSCFDENQDSIPCEPFTIETEDGQVLYDFLDQEKTMYTLTFPKNSLYQYIENYLVKVVLGDDVTFKGIEAKKGEFITFNFDGTPSGMSIQQDRWVKNFEVSKGDQLGFSPDLQFVSFLSLGSNRTIEHLPLTQFDSVFLDDTGSVFGVVVNSPKQLLGFHLAKDEKLFLRDNKPQLLHIKQARPLELANGFYLHTDKEDQIFFNEEGHYAGIKLATPREIQGEIYPAKSFIKIKPNGELDIPQVSESEVSE